VGPRAGLYSFGKEITLLSLSGIERQFLSGPARSVDPIATASSQFPYVIVTVKKKRNLRPSNIELDDLEVRCGQQI
jgi:hypothetical protein